MPIQHFPLETTNCTPSPLIRITNGTECKVLIAITVPTLRRMSVDDVDDDDDEGDVDDDDDDVDDDDDDDDVDYDLHLTFTVNYFIYSFFSLNTFYIM
ncbi:unnamed protein product [Schistosoma mattheei]|uniref:Uncharacterized protein n=1 Tax=Schistosoma mattheei TaxID=31246 RepID=A0A183P4V6_9TREM|nr:unnamed protein product [Schistosoma mattheei]